VVPLRVGESFITQGDRVAAALNYVADNDIAVAGMAIGSLSHGAHTAAAVHNADAAGVVLVGVAGDENSYHHNWPATEDPILYVHSIRGDNQNEDSDVASYMAIWNCNNWGPRLDLVAPSAECGTGAVAMIAGGAGLIVSAGREQGLTLGPDEVKALLRNTADDVMFTESDQVSLNSYPAHAGWDPYYGYGRMNLGAAVSAVYSGDLPPVARLDSPGWFALIDPGAPLGVAGEVASPRGTVDSWTLDVGVGADPSEWAEVASGTGTQTGTLAEVDVKDFGHHAFAELDQQDVNGRMERAHKPLITLVLTVTDGAGAVTTDRMGVWLQRDPDIKPGFPIDMGGSLEAAPITADLDGDGIFEILVITSDGAVHALNGDGSIRPGFPVQVESGVFSGPAVGDLDGDGKPEVVVATLGGQIWAMTADGVTLEGFPVTIVGREPEERGPATGWDNGFMSTPALGDADKDGDLDIVIGGGDQRLYVVDERGLALPGYPLELCQHPTGCSEEGARILASPALGDIDGDGDLDAAVGTNELPQGAAGPLYILDLGGATLFDGMPLLRSGLINESLLPVIGEGHPTSVSLADVDGDGDLEIASNPMLGNNGLIHHDGTSALDLYYTTDHAGVDSNFDGGAFLAAVTGPAFGDLNGDGTPDVVIGGAGVDWLMSLVVAEVVNYQHAIGAWDGKTGAALPGWPRQIDDLSFLVSPSLADVDGDGDVDVLYPSAGHLFYAWDAAGNLAAGWPKFTGGWTISGPALGDIDGDGWTDVVLATREGDLFAWTTQGPADVVPQWASNRHDAQNTGNWHTALPSQAGPPVEADAGGCCNKKKTSGGAAWMLLPVLLWGRASRRRA
jgi:hypothetical protein